MAGLSPKAAWGPISKAEWSVGNIRHLLRRTGFSADPVDVSELQNMEPIQAVQFLYARASKFAMPENFRLWHETRRVELHERELASMEAVEEEKGLLGGLEPEPAAEEESVDQPTGGLGKPAGSGGYGGFGGSGRGGGFGGFGGLGGISSSGGLGGATIKRRSPRQIAEEESTRAYHDFGYGWLQFALQRENAQQEKLVSFLSNLFHVTFSDEINKDAGSLYMHQQTIRDFTFGPYNQLCMEMAKTPAVIDYYELKRNVKGYANRKFIRSLFENCLFGLGEDGYTDADIGEASRSFTGFDYDFKTLAYVQRSEDYDNGRKKFFGGQGNFSSHDIIRLSLRMPKGLTHLPDLICRTFVRPEPLPKEHIRALGTIWQENNYDLGVLFRTVFTSKLFFSSTMRGKILKSPLQFYLGLFQDLKLELPPFSKRALDTLQALGQGFYTNQQLDTGDPNIWFNNSTVAVRRALVESVFHPVDESKLTEDEKVQLLYARRKGGDRFYLDDHRLEPLAVQTDEWIIDYLVQKLLPVTPDKAFLNALKGHISGVRVVEKPPDSDSPGTGKLPGKKGGGAVAVEQKKPPEKVNITIRIKRVKEAMIAVLQSPYYQIC